MPLWGTEDTLEGKPKIFGRSNLHPLGQITTLPKHFIWKRNFWEIPVIHLFGMEL